MSRASCTAVLFHEQVGHAAQHEDGGDGPQQDDRHGCSPLDFFVDRVLTWLPNAVPPLPVPCVARAAFAALVIVPAGSIALTLYAVLQCYD